MIGLAILIEVLRECFLPRERPPGYPRPCKSSCALPVGARLHVIHPLGFDMDEKARRRAGLDYWEHVDVREHASWPAYVESAAP